MKPYFLLSAAVLGTMPCLYLQAQQPNILFIVAEDASPDFGCYGNPHVTTPNIDNLATQGVRFTNAYTTSSVSSPSRGSIFTGLYPHQNGQFGLATHRYEMFSGVKTLPVYMQEVGYRSGCLGKIHVNPESEIPFDFWDIRHANFAKKNLGLYAEKSEEFMRESDQPFFLMVNFPDAHFPVQRQVEGRPSIIVEPDDINGGLSFVGIDSPEIRQNTANYYNCINRLDESVGILLEALDRTEKTTNTVVIFISDHGAQFSRGKHSNYEAGLKIPFIVKWPDLIPAGDTKNELISVIDLLPTFIHIAGGRIPSYLPGENLFSLWEEKSVIWRDYLFAGGMGTFPQVHFPKRSVRDKKFKLIQTVNYGKENPHYKLYESHFGHFSGGSTAAEIESAPPAIQRGYHIWRFPPHYELYDLENDPDEWNNLVEDPQYTSVLAELQKVLYDWRKDACDMILYLDKLQLINEEMESTYRNKEINNYQKNPAFRYRYLDYLRPQKSLNQDSYIVR